MPAAARSELQRRLSAGRWPALRLALPLAVPQADASPKLICSRSVLVGENTSAIFMKEPVVLLSLEKKKTAASVDAMDSEVRGPSIRVHRRGLSGTAGRQAQSEQA